MLVTEKAFGFLLAALGVQLALKRTRDLIISSMQKTAQRGCIVPARSADYLASAAACPS
jgi:hypothetical protein